MEFTICVQIYCVGVWERNVQSICVCGLRFEPLLVHFRVIMRCFLCSLMDLCSFSSHSTTYFIYYLIFCVYSSDLLSAFHLKLLLYVNNYGSRFLLHITAS